MSEPAGSLRPTAARSPARALRRALREEPIVRAIEAHNGLTALIGSNAEVRGARFHAHWSGSLTTAASKGMPDTGVVTLAQRIQVLDEIRASSTRPVLIDAESGGDTPEEIVHLTRALEDAQASAIVFEDKVGPKFNSFAGGTASDLADLDMAVGRIRHAVQARRGPDMLIVGRLEGLVLGLAEEETVVRALAMQAAGADMILPHSKRSQPEQILSFAAAFRAAGGTLPLAAIPTTYAVVDEAMLLDHQFSLVVYANQLLRAAWQPMIDCAHRILADRSVGPVTESLAPIRDILRIEEFHAARLGHEPG